MSLQKPYVVRHSFVFATGSKESSGGAQIDVEKRNAVPVVLLGAGFWVLPRVQKWGFLVCASNCPRGKSRIRLDSTGYKPSCGFCHGGKGLFKKRVRFWVDHGRAWVAAYWFCHGCKLPSLHFCHGFKIFLDNVFATRSTTLLYRWQISSPNG